jgi:hypothetical protein
LTGAGLLLRTVQGRKVYFRANQEAPILPELQGLFAKTAGLTDVLREALAPLSARVLVAFLFGSAARGELKASSDIDLLVVGDAPFQDVVASLAGAQEPSTSSCFASRSDIPRISTSCKCGQHPLAPWLTRFGLHFCSNVTWCRAGVSHSVEVTAERWVNGIMVPAE